LDKVFSDFGGKTFEELIDYTHTLKEWIKAKEMHVSEIFPPKILEAVGKTQPEIDNLMQRLEALDKLSSKLTEIFEIDDDFLDDYGQGMKERYAL
jgi:short-subunit dehydrogenase involved in D-alanine esterification of teichoic acids